MKFNPIKGRKSMSVHAWVSTFFVGFFLIHFKEYAANFICNYLMLFIEDAELSMTYI